MHVVASFPGCGAKVPPDQDLRPWLLNEGGISVQPSSAVLRRERQGSRRAAITGLAWGRDLTHGVVTMQCAMVVTFSQPVRGREEKALAYGAEVMEFWGKRASEAKCSPPELFFSEHGTGLWMVKGDRDTLLQIHDTDEARLLTLKGDLLLEGFSLDFVYAGDAAADYMTRYATALTTIS
jgi:hypothetical protein